METKLNVTLIQHTPEPEKVVAAAAKLCYSHSDAAEIMDDLTEEAVSGFLNRLVDMGHMSPVEHASFTFAIEGVSRSLTHQLVRHRMASYSQKSQRYVSEGQFHYIVPPEIAAIPQASKAYEEAMASAQAHYDELADLLVAKHEAQFMAQGMDEKAAKGAAEKKGIEDARYVLPNACETKIVVTMNVRELLHFFNHRCCQRAQWEIRECATQMLMLCKQVAPILFKNAGPNCVKGACPEGRMSCGRSVEMRKKFKKL